MPEDYSLWLHPVNTQTQSVELRIRLSASSHHLQKKDQYSLASPLQPRILAVSSRTDGELCGERDNHSKFKVYASCLSSDGRLCGNG
jgi:hypothetical protein